MGSKRRIENAEGQDPIATFVKHNQCFQEGKSLVIFLIGQSRYLEEEAVKYGDLLQVDVRETYRNLVYKVINYKILLIKNKESILRIWIKIIFQIEAGFRWINAKIKSDFVVKVDSDSVVHIDRLYGKLLKVEGW